MASLASLSASLGASPSGLPQYVRMATSLSSGGSGSAGQHVTYVAAIARTCARRRRESGVSGDGGKFEGKLGLLHSRLAAALERDRRERGGGSSDVGGGSDVADALLSALAKLQGVLAKLQPIPS